jgi:hypothetical protein
LDTQAAATIRKHASADNRFSLLFSLLICPQAANSLAALNDTTADMARCQHDISCSHDYLFYCSRIIRQSFWDGISLDHIKRVYNQQEYAKFLAI